MFTISLHPAPAPAGTADAGSSNAPSRLTRIRRAVAPWAASALVLSLAACGGGGGGGGGFPIGLGTTPSSTTNPTTNPTTDPTTKADTPTHKVTGSVSGLAGTGLVLQNGTDELPISANGSVTLALALPEGLAYNVTVKSQPTGPTQICTVNGGSGTVGTNDIIDVAVVCSTTSFNVSGNVSGLKGSGLVLQNNGGDDITVAADSLVDFGNVASGADYKVTVKTQPAYPVQTCTVNKGTGTVNDVAISNVAVVCATNSYTVGGKVTNLDGHGLMLQNNAGDDLPVDANGDFTFHAPVASKADYAVSVKTQPTDKSQTCSVNNATGTIVGSAVSNVIVNCEVNSFKVTVNVTGLDGKGLVLTNYGSDDLPIDTSASQFTFKRSVASGSGYEVAVKTNPTLVTQNCTVTNGSGIIGGADVANVNVACESQTARYAYLTSALGKVWAYGLDTTSGLLLDSPRSVNSDAGPLSIAVDATGTHGYVAALSGIDQYGVGSVVAAMSPGKVAAGSLPTGLVLDPKNRFAYVLNTFDGFPSSGKVSVLSIDGTSGALAATPAASTGLLPLALAADPLGRYVYVGNFGSSLAKIASRITVYSVAEAEQNKLTVGASTNTTGKAGVAALAADPSGRFVYALTGNLNVLGIRSLNDLAGIASVTIEGFTISDNGTLVTMGPQSIAGNAPATSITMDPSGRFAYVALTNGALRLYAIDATTGALTAGADTPALNSAIVRVSADPAGKFLYAATASDVHTYAINHETGELTLAGSTHTPTQTTVFTSMALGL